MNSLFDLSQLSFEEFISFFFDHDITTEGDWYENPDFDNLSDWDDEGIASPVVIVEHMTRLFVNFEGTVSK